VSWGRVFREGKRFFFEKKKQKTFDLRGGAGLRDAVDDACIPTSRGSPSRKWPDRTRVFWSFFAKKDYFLRLSTMARQIDVSGIQVKSQTRRAVPWRNGMGARMRRAGRPRPRAGI
jgi:hypothetical protein